MQFYTFDSKTLTYQAVKNRWLKPFILVALLFTMLGFGSAVKVNRVVERIPVILSFDSDSCTDSSVKEYILQLNLKFPKIVYQQAVLESGHYQSPVFKELNNIVCMENARVRPTIGKDVGVRFASYSSWKESLIDYAIWQATYARDITREEDYYYLLDKLYCPANLKENSGLPYSSRLKQIPWQ